RLLRHAGMRGRCRVTGERYRAAEADRQFEHLHAVETSKGLRLSSLDVEGKRRSWRAALRIVNAPRRRIRAQERQVVDLCRARRVAQELGDDGGSRVVALQE